jgi:hypothetical protein
MRRREFTTFLASAALVRPVQAQSLHHLRRIGVLWPGPSAPPPPRMEAFDQGLRDAGMVQGQDVAVELRYSAQGVERLRELAIELIKLDVGAIVAFGHFGTPRCSAGDYESAHRGDRRRCVGSRTRYQSCSTRREYHRSDPSLAGTQCKTTSGSQGNSPQLVACSPPLGPVHGQNPSRDDGRRGTTVECGATGFRSGKPE